MGYSIFLVDGCNSMLSITVVSISSSISANMVYACLIADVPEASSLSTSLLKKFNSA